MDFNYILNIGFPQGLIKTKPKKKEKESICPQSFNN